MRCNVPKLTKRERDAVTVECERQFAELLKDFNRQAAVQVLYVLHVEYGFGQSRLEDFARKLTAVQTGLETRYEMKRDDTPFLCETRLRADHIDVDKLLGGDGE